jgi:membrane protein implicated in regulation of membrane protease activity
MREKKLLAIPLALVAFALLMLTAQITTLWVDILAVVVAGLNAFFAWRLWTRE